MIYELLTKRWKTAGRAFSLMICLALMIGMVGTMAAYATTEEDDAAQVLTEVETEQTSQQEDEDQALESTTDDAAPEAANANDNQNPGNNNQGTGNNNQNAGGNSQGTTDTISVYYDRVVTSGSTTTPTLTAQNDSQGIESVVVNGQSVTHADGSSGSYGSASTATLTYDKSTTTATVSLTVTPEEGYYVTFIAVCCCGGTGTDAATECSTYSGGNAFEGSFTIEDEGAITVNVMLYNAEGFHHTSDSETYFVMVAVAKVPTPLYVEYNYGDIVELIGDASASTAFTTASGWTDANSGNVYGSTDQNQAYGIMTANTQYKYVYPSDSDASSESWIHYANSITDQAKAQAAAAGYYFAGWKATYYTDCQVSENASGSYNNYTYSFSSQYGSTSDYLQEGESVPMSVHVKLTAIWVQATITPGSLTITKSFVGLEAGEYPDAIQVAVTMNGESIATVTLNAANNWSATLSDLNAGTYVLTESGYQVNGYECTTTVNGTEVSGTSATVILSAGRITSAYNSSTGLYEYSGSISSGSATFVNTYTPSEVVIDLTKIITGNMADLTGEFTFTVEYVDRYGVAKTQTITLGNNQNSGTIAVKKDSSVTITEGSYSPYQVTATVNGESVSVSGGSLTFVAAQDTSVVVTNTYNVVPDTGIGLDTLPYVMLLATVALAAVVLLRKKKTV